MKLTSSKEYSLQGSGGWGELPGPDVLKVNEVYKDFAADIGRLVTTMAISADVSLVDSAFGKI